MNTNLKLALQAGLIYEEVKGSGVTYWTEGNAEDALDKFAKLIIEASKNEEVTA